MRILVVEDEPDAARYLAKGLRQEAFAVDTAEDGWTALGKAHLNLYDIVLLDVMLPDSDGFSICKELRRAKQNMPILMLTSRDAVADRVEGLDSGADDYLVKPFDFGELLARIRALLRRQPKFLDPVIRIADLVVDTHHRKVMRAGRIISLTTREYALLEYLAFKRGAVAGRAEISEHVWDENYDPVSNLIDVYVQRLRRKVDYEFGMRLIHTRRGEGYQLALETSIYE